MKDAWKSGDSYEYFMGRWSSIVARQFLSWLSPRHGLKWLDVGCGSGALSESAMNGYSPQKLIAIDQSGEFVETTKRRLNGNAICQIGNALNLPVAASSVDLTVSGLVLNFIPNVEKYLAEMMRITVKGGIVAVYIWDYAGKMEFLQNFWEAAEEINIEASSLNEAKRFSDFSFESLSGFFIRAGFKEVITTSIEIDTFFTDFDDYWMPFFGGQGPAPNFLLTLNKAEKEQLKNCIYGRLPIEPDGSIHLSARAFAVQGIVFG